MVIEQIFYEKFIERFPNVPLYPLVAPKEQTGLYAIYMVSDREIEIDLSRNAHLGSVTIQVFINSYKYKEATEIVWDIIKTFETMDSFDNVEKIDVRSSGNRTASNDSYDFELSMFQISINMEITFLI